MAANGNGEYAIGAVGSEVQFGGTPFVDPNSFSNGSNTGNADAGSADGNSGKRKYTRRTKAEMAAARGEDWQPGDTSRTARKDKASEAQALTADKIAPAIMMVHMMAAARFPRMAMQQAEADQLAAAMAGYLRYTKIGKVKPETQALYALITTLILVEGTRVVATLQDFAAAKAANTKFGNETVVPIDESNIYNMPMANA